VVDQFAEWLKQKEPGIKNFDRRNIYRIRQFFLAYSSLEIQKNNDGLSFVVSTKPQIQIADNDINNLMFSIKPLCHIIRSVVNNLCFIFLGYIQKSINPIRNL
jgi:hypothetical protein